MKPKVRRLKRAAKDLERWCEQAEAIEDKSPELLKQIVDARGRLLSYHILMLEIELT